MLWGMRPLLCLLFTSMALAQQGEDARPLLQQVADTARNAKSWRAEYLVMSDMEGEGVHVKTEMHFKESSQGPNLMRREGTLAGSSILITCDGADTWIYLPASKQYQKRPGTTAACVPSMNTWGHLLDGLQSAVIMGGDTIVLEGKPTPCDLVRAEYVWLPSGTDLPGGTVIVSTGTQTMCVDRSRSLILRNNIEIKGIPNSFSPNGMRATATIVYSSVERDPALAPDLFTFEPPAGSTLAANLPPALGALLGNSPAPLLPGGK